MHNVENILHYIFWILNSLFIKLDQLRDKVIGNDLRRIGKILRYFAWSVGLALYPKSRPFLIHQRSAVNQRPVMVSLKFFTPLMKLTMKIKKFKLAKNEHIAWHCYFRKIKKDQELVYSLHNRV